MDEDSDSESDSSISTPGIKTNEKRKRPKAKRIQSFVDEWLSDKQFKYWLSKRVGKENKPQPYCNCCQKFVTCSKTGLKRHSTSSQHKKNINATGSCAGTLTSCFTNASTRDESSSIEIKLSALPLSLPNIIYPFRYQIIW